MKADVKRFDGQSQSVAAVGPAGSGKTSVIRVLAADLGLDLCEWRPSASMAWFEHQQQPERQQVLCHTQ